MHKIVTKGTTLLAPRRPYEGGPAAHARERVAGVMAELGEIARTEVGQFVMLPVTPNVLHRIEFGGATRQPFDRELTPLRADKFADQSRPMFRQPVPDHQHVRRSQSRQLTHFGRRVSRHPDAPERY